MSINLWHNHFLTMVYHINASQDRQTWLYMVNAVGISFKIVYIKNDEIKLQIVWGAWDLS